MREKWKRAVMRQNKRGIFVLICSAMIRKVKNINEQNKEELWQQYVFWIKMEHLL